MQCCPYDLEGKVHRTQADLYSYVISFNNNKLYSSILKKNIQWIYIIGSKVKIHNLRHKIVRTSFDS